MTFQWVWQLQVCSWPANLFLHFRTKQHLSAINVYHDQMSTAYELWRLWNFKKFIRFPIRYGEAIILGSNDIVQLIMLYSDRVWIRVRDICLRVGRTRVPVAWQPLSTFPCWATNIRLQGISRLNGPSTQPATTVEFKEVHLKSNMLWDIRNFLSQTCRACSTIKSTTHVLVLFLDESCSKSVSNFVTLSRSSCCISQRSRTQLELVRSSISKILAMSRLE